MAVIERRSFCVGAALLLTAAPLLQSAQADEIRLQLSELANALTAGNPSDAMTYFSKSLPNYGKLRNYFDGLTNAFAIRSELDVLDEEDSANESKARLRWAITLSNSQTDESEHRAAEMHVRFVREKGKWKIVEFAPIEIFDPGKS